ncbi:NUDIX hydrolase [Acuticoccus sp. M5D2P5]|uniref:NUDIX hydrolase n=1 Tax=Acuticoccus kalidii TaxID=2910977 RepID=UPI001F19C0D9|nr:NUDIX hydrolase [Acuticoccus kalidii]MCF3935520.1 NUDIX hydrolase [Acuticoccus kalidii]
MTTAEALMARMNEAERNQKHPPITVRDASSILILDRSGAEPKLLMGRRSARHAFMPNHFVFPGGRVDPGDSRVQVAAPYDETTLGKLTREMRNGSGAARARALGVAALREAYEETGVIIGRTGEAALPRGTAWQPFAQRDVALDLGAMRFLLRAITPPGRPRRYDTRFFVVNRDAVADIDPDCVGEDAELEEICWVTIDEARTMPLPTITLTVLDELMARLDADPSLPSDAPVPFYRWVRNGFLRTTL